MSVSLDKIADLMINWCEQDSDTLREYFTQKGGWKSLAQKEFEEFLKPRNCDVEVIDNQPVYHPSGSIDWVFVSTTNNHKPEVLAELTCESLETFSQFETEIEMNIEKLKNINLKEEYKEATKCIITLYFDVEKREYLHAKNFIEVFNNFEIGCAILRIK